MVKKITILGIIAVILSSVLFTGCGEKNPGILYSLKSDDPVYFEQAAKDAYKFKSELVDIKAGICSHHLYTVNYISGFFNLLKSSTGKIGTFIIIGPNHYSRGSAVVSLTDRKWKTPFGFIDHDPVFTGKLIDNGYGEIDNDAFTFEHSMGALIPFIRQYFPDSKVVPVLLKHALSVEKASEMGKFLANETDDSVFILLSSDFVHNKKKDEIVPIDKRTAAVLNSYKNYFPFPGLPILEMDCNRGLGILMSYASEKKYSLDILLNTNSAFMSDMDVSATSYFFVFLGRPEE